MTNSIFASPAPYHIISYGTLLGTQFYQSFVGGIVAFRALPRPQFSQLQRKIFPVYFSIQTALPALLALTYPGTKGPLGVGSASSLSGVLAEQNRWTVLVPLATMFITSLVNLVAIGPASTRIMKERYHQETRDGKKSYDPAPHSKEMQRLNKAFGRMHGASALVNLVSLGATLYYGFVLGARIE